MFSSNSKLSVTTNVLIWKRTPVLRELWHQFFFSTIYSTEISYVGKTSIWPWCFPEWMKTKLVHAEMTHFFNSRLVTRNQEIIFKNKYIQSLPYCRLSSSKHRINTNPPIQGRTQDFPRGRFNEMSIDAINYKDI